MWSPKGDLELIRPQIPSQGNGNLETVSIGSYIDGLDEPCITIAMIAYGDDESSIRDLLKRIDDSAPDGALSSWLCEKTSLQKELDRKAEAYPDDHRCFVDNAWINNDADIVALLEPAFTNLPSRESLVLWQSMIPCSRRQLPDMAVSLQSDHYLSLYAIWEKENDDIRCQSTVEEVMLGIGPHSVGSYLGELDFRSRKTNYWGEEQHKRLVDVRTKWDSTHRICGCLGLEDMDNK